MNGLLQSLLEVRKAEAYRFVHNLLGKSLRERDVLIRLELVLPVLDVQLALLVVRVVEYAKLLFNKE